MEGEWRWCLDMLLPSKSMISLRSQSVWHNSSTNLFFSFGFIYQGIKSKWASYLYTIIFLICGKQLNTFIYYNCNIFRRRFFFCSILPCRLLLIKVLFRNGRLNASCLNQLNGKLCSLTEFGRVLDMRKYLIHSVNNLHFGSIRRGFKLQTPCRCHNLGVIGLSMVRLFLGTFENWL